MFKKKSQDFRVMSEDVDLALTAVHIGAHFFLYSENRSIRVVVSLHAVALILFIDYCLHFWIYAAYDIFCDTIRYCIGSPLLG